MKYKIVSTLVLFQLISNLFFGQTEKNMDLVNLHSKSKLQVVNRTVNAVSDDSVKWIRVSERKGEGIVWLPIEKFANGNIQIEMRGKNVLQRSFIGIAFNGLNDSTYDAVYCRPFNFFTKDSVRKIHAIQYISHPIFTWKKLREEKNAMYEKEILNPPDPDGWFTMRLVIENNLVKAFINKSDIPSLVVEKISDWETGRIGLFVGDSSGGDFKNIEVTIRKK
jgi:hypothetical protein